MVRLVRIIFTVSIGLNFISSDYLVHNANTTVADDLAKKVRVVCLLTVSVKDHVKLAEAIKETWGKRCNKLAFVNDHDSNTPQNTPLQRHKYRMHVAFNQFREVADWFVFSSGGYMLVENLRLMLSEYDPKDEIYFKPDIGWEGLKFVINKNALNRLVTMDLSYYPFCNFSSNVDISIACLNSVGFHQVDSKDFLNRERVLQQSPYSDQYKRSNCYSDFAVSFDDVTPHMMYVIDYLIYQLRPFGINFDTNIPKSQKEFNKLLHGKRKKVKKDKQENEFIVNNYKVDREKIKYMQKILNYNPSTALDKVITIRHKQRSR